MGKKKSRRSGATHVTSTLALPQQKPTDKATMRISLTELIMHWNFDVPKDLCCPFHAGLHAVQTIAAEIRETTQCKKDLKAFCDSFQCQACGWLSGEPTETGADFRCR